ncbi:hypothetical protein J27TS7_10830 [Paenibacillus dendritiformis]|nr:hypothetical protein J27TS7_10830 [Paenibacillus dendritiformis]
MDKEISYLKEQAETYRALYKRNMVSRQEALESVTPYIDAVNQKSVSLAKKYNLRPKLVNVSSYLR